MPNRVDIAAFQKVMIVYNRNSGKQLFASMLARVNEVKKRLKQVIDPKSLEIVEIKYLLLTLKNCSLTRTLMVV